MGVYRGYYYRRHRYYGYYPAYWYHPVFLRLGVSSVGRAGVLGGGHWGLGLGALVRLLRRIFRALFRVSVSGVLAYGLRDCGEPAGRL